MTVKTERFSYAEELANALSHFTAAIFGAIALVLMCVFSLRYGNFLHIAASVTFGVSIILLYLSSTLNHWLPKGKTKEFFFNFDQIAIYLLIAGSYTPITLLAVKGTFGWSMFVFEWFLAALGIAIKIFKPGIFEKSVNIFTIVTYVVMGWLILIILPSLYASLGLAGLLWIIIGGLFYSVGIIFFKLEKMPYHHLIWHLFVICGTVSHFISVYYYILPL